MSTIKERAIHLGDLLRFENSAFKSMTITEQKNIFDFQFAVRERRNLYREIYDGNCYYGMGTQMREYAAYKGQLYCAFEHAIHTVTKNNTNETSEHAMPIVFTSSTERKRIIETITDKIVVAYGPQFMPYVKPIYDDFTMKTIKRNLGRVLVVYPEHTNDASYTDSAESRTRLIHEMEELKEREGFNHIIVCIYYLDILNGGYLEYEKAGWTVISAGNNKNYDFGKCARTIMELADCVVSQGGWSTIIQATYLGIPSLFLKGADKREKADGSFIDLKKEAFQITYEECERYFGTYTRKISEEQNEWCAKWGGFADIKTPQEMNLLFTYAHAIRNCGKDKKKMKRILNQGKYQPIRKYIDLRE